MASSSRRALRKGLSEMSRIRSASTSASTQEWTGWLKAAASDLSGRSGTALLLAGLGTYPHVPKNPSKASLDVWAQASEALLKPDARMGYTAEGLSEQEWKEGLRGWVAGRSLEELMQRPDVTAAFILTSTIAILASAQENTGTPGLLPVDTRLVLGHGFVGTLSALVAAGRVSLEDGVRLTRMYALLPAHPDFKGKSRSTNPESHLTTVLTARTHPSHSLSNPPVRTDSTGRDVPLSPMGRLLHEIKRFQKEELGLDGIQVEKAVDEHWTGVAMLNSDKICVVSGTYDATINLIENVMEKGLAMPVMDVPMPCPYHTPLMSHAVPILQEALQGVHFREPSGKSPICIIDPVTTLSLDNPRQGLLGHLTRHLRWGKVTRRLWSPGLGYPECSPGVKTVLTVGKGAKGLGVMLEREMEIQGRADGKEAEPVVEVGELGASGTVKRRAR